MSYLIVMARSMLFVNVELVTLVEVATVKSGESIPVPDPMMLFFIISFPASIFSRCTAYPVYVPYALMSLMVSVLHILSAQEVSIMIRS